MAGDATMTRLLLGMG
ncbi:hypothetical protein ACU4HD_47025 [Cupriavidus basilensis]